MKNLIGMGVALAAAVVFAAPAGATTGEYNGCVFSGIEVFQSEKCQDIVEQGWVLGDGNSLNGPPDAPEPEPAP